VLDHLVSGAIGENADIVPFAQVSQQGSGDESLPVAERRERRFERT
jgi:hypothetical protein